jgi:hypothetical protein
MARGIFYEESLMHHIKTQIREIKPDELPTVRDRDGAVRQANKQELLDLGYERVGESNFFSSIHQERTDADGNWKVHEGHERHGRLITEGILPDRHKRLPADVRRQILHAHVFRSTDSGEDLNAHIAGVMKRAKVPAEKQREATLEHLRHRASIKGDPVEQHFIPMAQIQAGDVVESDGHYPHQWANEPQR